MSAVVSLVPPAPVSESRPSARTVRRAFYNLYDVDRCERQTIRDALEELAEDQRDALLFIVGRYPDTLNVGKGERAILFAAICMHFPVAVDLNVIDALDQVFAAGPGHVHRLIASLPISERMALHATVARHANAKRALDKLDLGALTIQRERKRGLYRLALRMGLTCGEEPSL